MGYEKQKKHQNAVKAHRLNDTLAPKVAEIFPEMSVPQQRNMVWLMIGIYLSRNVQLSKIVEYIASSAKETSIVRRISRFLAQFGADVKTSYAKQIVPILKCLSMSGQIRLLIDGSKVGFGHQLVMVSVAYKRRSIPVAWTWVKYKRGHSTGETQVKLLSEVKTLIQELKGGVKVSLCGDSEYGNGEVLMAMKAWGWQYALRQKGSHLVSTDGNAWQNLQSLVCKAGESVWLPDAYLTQAHAIRCNLCAYWAKGQPEAWLIATNLPDHNTCIKAYGYRMWIEEMFGDLKKHGFDLESTHLLDTEKLSRLTLAVVLLYVWLLCYGARLTKQGLRHWVDRHDRRDLSFFQIGFRYLKRLLKNDAKLPKMSLLRCI